MQLHYVCNVRPYNILKMKSLAKSVYSVMEYMIFSHVVLNMGQRTQSKDWITAETADVQFCILPWVDTKHK